MNKRANQNPVLSWLHNIVEGKSTNSIYQLILQSHNYLEMKTYIHICTSHIIDPHPS